MKQFDKHLQTHCTANTTNLRGFFSVIGACVIFVAFPNFMRQNKHIISWFQSEKKTEKIVHMWFEHTYHFNEPEQFASNPNSLWKLSLEFGSILIEFMWLLREFFLYD